MSRIKIGEEILKVVAADSGAAILDNSFEALQVVAASAVLVEPPYSRVSYCLAEPIFAKVETGPLLVVHELELCRNLLKEVKADVVHLDMSFRGISIEELSVVSLSQMRISRKARGHVIKILPKLRKIGADIKRVYGIEVLAIGKESVPVRIAELTSGANAVLYSAERAIQQASVVRLGLPAKCSAKIVENGVTLQSLIPAEHDIMGSAKDEKGVLEKVGINEMPNPCARGFRVLEMTPKGKS
ncbi:MAG: DUF4152 family protein [Candidatus Bathyarchaeota archaeon]